MAGAEQFQLIGQFLCESVLITCMALALAIGLVILCLPAFNQVAATQISLSGYFSWKLLFVLSGLVVLLGTVAGIYPAFYLSGLRLVKVFKNSGGRKGSLLPLRKVLVVFQFTLSVILIVATMVTGRQLHYMQTQDLGFDKEQVVAIPMYTQTQSLAKDKIKAEFEKAPGVTAITASSSIPGRELNNIMTLPEGVPKDQGQTMNTLVVDNDFIPAYKLKMAAGRAFSSAYPTDSSAFILNEAAVKEIGWGDPEHAIGKGFDWGLGKKGKIIGVVKDFHFRSLQQKIVPLVMHIQPLNSGWYGYISVRVNTHDVQQTIAALRDAWKKYLPDGPFDYYFVNEEYDKQYQAEQRLGHLSILFAMLTIFISCLGLFGLVMVAVSQRTKEIGVRKVLGASVTGITALLSKDFLGLIAIANLIALPLSWWCMYRWLSDFPYRVALSWWIFVLAALLVLAIALTTVAFQAIKAALANPVKNLRTE